jgi:hypothetical protein
VRLDGSATDGVGMKIGGARTQGSSGDWHAARSDVWEWPSTWKITHLGSSTAPGQDELRRYNERRREGRSALFERWSELRSYMQYQTKVAQSHPSRAFRWIEGVWLIALSVLLIAVTVRPVRRNEL